jgi:hypothetical protein
MKALIAVGLGAIAGLMTAVQAATLSPLATYHGMCDASAAISLNAELFAVANDEDNILRVYHRQPGSLPAFSFDMTSFLQIGKKKPETDMEACANIGGRVYWITSHGRNAKGKDSPNRERFFATTFILTNGLVKLIPVGKPYPRMLDDLIREPRLARYNLAMASRLAPKEPGALNIEGLTATPEGTLLIGFRNPIPHGKAMLVPLLNPAQVIEGLPSKFGDPIFLDLGGHGIRSLGMGGGKYLIIAGSFDNDGESRAYEWDGTQAAPRHLSGIRFPGLNPEGLAFTTASGHIEYYVLSDDGTLQVNGVDCKKLKDPSQRRFRGYSLEP